MTGDNIVVTGNGWTANQIKAYIEALLAEKDRALEMADDEREKAAAALRNEQQRAIDQASRERDKAAENLRIELLRSQGEGDDRLREHIANQIMQIQSALASADKLELERVAVIAREIESVKRELTLLFHASEKAIEKAESATAKQFESTNEWRGQSADRERSQIETMNKLALTYLPREVYETAMKQTLSRVTTLEQMQASSSGETSGATRFRVGLFAGLGALATLIGIVVALNTYTGHDAPPTATTVTVTVPK